MTTFYQSIAIILTGLLLVSPFLLTSCRSDVNQQVNMTVTSEAADGLDLKAITALLKTVKTPQELEKKINSGNPRISNLDLNEDDKIDYVKVTEYSKDQIRGFSLTTELGENDVQELATIEVIEDGEGVYQAQTSGNRQIYGNNYYHHSGFGLGDALLMSYLFSSHSPYRSPYGYSRYPTNFSRSKPIPKDRYQSRMSQLDTTKISRSSKPTFKESSASPNKSRVSNRVKAPLRNPTKSQKSFQARNPSRTVRSGGFGSKSSSGSIRNSPRTGTSFGRGK